MKTLSAEQYKKMYGEDAYSSLGGSNAPQQSGAISQAFHSGISQTKEGYQSAKNASNPLQLLEGSTKMLAGGINTIFSPLAPITAPINKAVDYTADKISDNPSIQKFATSKAGEATGRIAEDVGNLSTVAGTVAGGLEVPKVGEGISNLAKKSVSKTADEATNVADSATRLNTAIQDATPHYESSTAVQKGKLLSRVQEGGMLKGRTVKPNTMEIEAGTELSNVPGYDPSATKLAKYQAAEAENIKRAQALESSLKSEKIAVPKREIVSKVKKVIDEVPNNSLLLAKSDPVIKNYLRVVQNAVNQVDGTLSGVLKLRKMLDDTYKNAKGKQAFGSDKISALDEIHKPVRDALTQYLIDHAQNTNVKASLRSQWNLYRAMDELQTAAQRESGSMVGRAIQKHPITSKVIETGARATGLGAGIHVLK